MKKLILRAALAMALLWAGAAPAVTIYVNTNNTAGPWDGLTPATAWTNIAQGLTHLAATNAVVQGGHTVNIATGNYAYVTLTSAHAGTNGAYNTFLASGEVAINGAASYNCFELGASNAIIDGFRLTNGLAGIYEAANNWIVRNCRIHNNRGNGVSCNWGSNGQVTNCNIYGNWNSGISLDSSSLKVKDCIITDNPRAGIYGYLTYGSQIANNCIYGNGQECYNLDPQQRLETEAAINSLSGWTNNIIRNPGYVNLWSNWNFNGFYSNSPCLNSGAGGGDLGAYQDPPLIETSSNTYYVDASAGDDSRTKSQAQSPATPWKTFTNAAAQAVAGDTVMLAVGAYSGGAILHGGSHNAPLTFQAAGAVTVAGGGNPAIKFNRVAGVKLDGLTLTSSDTCLDSYASFANIITNVTLSGGTYGIKANDVDSITCKMIVDTCSFISQSYAINLRFTGGHIFRNCMISLISLDYAYNNIIRECDINQGGIRFSQGYGTTDLSIWNCNIYRCSYGLYSDYPATRVSVINCTMFSNTIAGIWYPTSGDMTSQKIALQNSIFANNGFGVYQSGVTNAVNTTNCLFFGNNTNFYANATAYQTANEINSLTGCTNNLVADPRLADAPNTNFLLLDGSPCIGAGVTVTNLTVDRYGTTRPIGNAYDIGSDEYMPPPGNVFRLR